ncbi:hypothetical protein NA78x_005846 [Anatilimnocola sp. NA78]|uniref:hypothetical protein n=1 Tax=Anatilimnocola sp. NA78 TaxID=3415683 RepID=UPI003CE56FDF
MAKKLSAADQIRKTLKETPCVIVYVWSKGPDSVAGHAAIGLSPAAMDVDSGYLSFNPAKDASTWDKLFGSPPSAHTRADDLVAYKRSKHFRAVICGLNMDKMHSRFAELSDKKTQSKYAVLTPGREVCSSAVKEVLKAGGGDKVASWWSSFAVGEWTPGDVKDYSTSIVNGTKDKGSVILADYR